MACERMDELIMPEASRDRIFTSLWGDSQACRFFLIHLYQWVRLMAIASEKVAIYAKFGVFFATYITSTATECLAAA